MKRWLSLMLAVGILFGGLGFSANAAEMVSYPMGYHTYTSTEDYACDEWKVSQRGAYLMSGTSTITRKDSTHINISGITTATQTCDEVVLTLYVERSKSYATGYSTYRSYDYEVNNDYQLVKERSNITVERGYYYRVKAVHSVKEGSTRETTNSVTNPLDFR